MARFLVINGPNLNFLGRRDPHIYGTTTLAQLEQHILKKAKEIGAEVAFFQSNSEGAIIDFVQEHGASAQGIIINPGALSRYGYALKDALIDSQLPVVEVHISNPYAREQWRRRSIITNTARGQVAGLGWRGYLAALETLAALIAEEGTK